MTSQEQADTAERAAIARYLALRTAFHPCWGRTLTLPARHRPRRAVPAARTARPGRPRG